MVRRDEEGAAEGVGRNKRSALRRFISNRRAEVAVETSPPFAPERRNALRLLRPTAGCSEARYVACDCLPLGGRKLLHYFYHVGIVGPIAFGKAAHRPYQIFVGFAPQPRRRQGAHENWLMTKLTNRYPARRRDG